MNEQSFSDIRMLVQTGDTAEAIRLLVQHLSGASQVLPEAVRQAQLLESRHANLRSQEIKGTIALPDAQRTLNQINESLLHLLDDLAAGRTERKPASGNSSKMRLGMLAALAVLIAVGGWFWLRRSAGDDCPKFANAPAGHILILPFQKVNGADAEPGLLLRNRIQTIGSKHFPIDVKIRQTKGLDLNNLDEPELTKISRECGADLVIFGIYNNVGGNLQVSTRLFVAGKGLGPDIHFQNLSDIGQLSNDKVFRSLDDAVFSLCAVMSYLAQKPDVTKKWMDKIVEKTERDKVVGK